VDSDSDDDDDLGDVSTMVKTIGGSANGVPMFKVSTRPGSSSGMPKIAKKASPSVIDIDEGDTTNYEALMPKPSSPRQSALRDATLMSDSEDDFSLVKPKPATTKLTKIPAKPKAVTKAKAPATVVAKKSTVLSPAAKAYAARLEKTSGAAKAKLAVKKPTLIDSDEEMDDADALANDILSDDDDEDEPTPKPKATGRAPAARPGRRAAAKPAKYVVSDDDDEDDASEASFDDESE
jgi:DNA topoisomerase-2